MSGFARQKQRRKQPPRSRRRYLGRALRPSVVPASARPRTDASLRVEAARNRTRCGCPGNSMGCSSKSLYLKCPHRSGGCACPRAGIDQCSGRPGSPAPSFAAVREANLGLFFPWSAVEKYTLELPPLIILVAVCYVTQRRVATAERFARLRRWDGEACVEACFLRDADRFYGGWGTYT